MSAEEMSFSCASALGRSKVGEQHSVSCSPLPWQKLDRKQGRGRQPLYSFSASATLCVELKSDSASVELNPDMETPITLWNLDRKYFLCSAWFVELKPI